MTERRNLYDEISGNKAKSLLLVVFFVLIVIALGWVFGMLTGYGNAGLVLAVFISILMSGVSWFYSDKIVLSLSHARPAGKKEFAYLHHTVEGLSIAAGIPVPEVYVIEDKALNAFATGRDPKNASIAVTTGLLEKLDRQELEGVLAHELSHVKNYDIRYMAMVAVLVGIIALLSDWSLRSFLWGGGNRDKGGGRAGGALIIIGLVFVVLAPIIAQLVKLSVSRKREFLADADGAMLSRNPQGLASALKKISGDGKQLASASNATAHLYFSNPFKENNWLSGLFSTHPPIEERIKRLEAAA